MKIWRYQNRGEAQDNPSLSQTLTRYFEDNPDEIGPTLARLIEALDDKGTVSAETVTDYSVVELEQDGD